MTVRVRLPTKNGYIQPMAEDFELVRDPRAQEPGRGIGLRGTTIFLDGVFTLDQSRWVRRV